MDEGSTCDFCDEPIRPSQGFLDLSRKDGSPASRAVTTGDIFCDAECQAAYIKMLNDQVKRLIREADQMNESLNTEQAEPQGRLRSTPTPPPPPKHRRPRLFSEEWQKRRDVEARNREMRKEAERKKGRMSEGMTVGIGLLVAFLLISGLGDCEGGGDCVDSYGQVRIDNC